MEFAKINKDPGNPMPFSRRSKDLKESVIIIGPEKPVKFHAGKILEARGLEVKFFCEAESALQNISPHWNGILMTHFNTPTLEDLGLLARVRQIDPDLPVLMILDQRDIPLVVKAMREGAHDIIPNSFSKKDILKITLEALEKRRLVLEFRKLQSEIRTSEKPGSFVTGRSRSMEHLRQTLHKASEVDAEVLLIGEAGTGKNLVARCIHDQSPRKHEKFIAIHCSAIP
jgi:two-component system C4-dicarboxylate transport response regulator DctD